MRRVIAVAIISLVNKAGGASQIILETRPWHFKLCRLWDTFNWWIWKHPRASHIQAHPLVMKAYVKTDDWFGDATFRLLLNDFIIVFVSIWSEHIRRYNICIKSYSPHKTLLSSCLIRVTEKHILLYVILEFFVLCLLVFTSHNSRANKAGVLTFSEMLTSLII